MEFPKERALYCHDPRLKNYTPSSLRTLRKDFLSGRGKERTACLKSIISYIEKSDRVDPGPFLEYLLDGHEDLKSIAKINLYNSALALKRKVVVDWLTDCFMEASDLHHAVRQIATYQNRESTKMFSEAMRRLDLNSKTPTLITDLLS